MIFAGIDLGTSGIKIALVNEEGACLASAARPSPVEIPHVGWSQQEPDQWWHLTCDIFDALAVSDPDLMARLGGISVSGHMLGPVLLDKDNRPTTPCILWNDQRALLECDELLATIPDIGWRTNGHPDPGLGAPKLLWLAKHMPKALDTADVLMLPKDYVVLQLTGERCTEYSDASGTMLMDCATCDWDDELLAAAGWDRARLPPLLQSCDPAGQLKPDLCRRWKTPGNVLVAAGSGDNYAAALGVGAAVSGRAALSIGTSGVLCAADHVFHPAPHQAILTTPHAAPGLFLSMGVVMSATQSLDWLSRLTSISAPDLAAMAQARATKGIMGCPLSRPSVTGVRTPDNRPDAQGFIGGLTAGHDASDLAFSILEGVAMQICAAYTAQKAAKVPIQSLSAVGGGTRSLFWVSLIATLLDTEINIPEQGEIAACLGAARMAQSAVYPEQRDAILSRRNQTKATAHPIASLKESLLERYQGHRTLPFSVG
ncbi:Xylulose kinase [Roseobacter fucihabitans]|uniref:Xylulose kinase n=1 Tax=Roseobacter fucihabitans TaxID=1537242 RepID=A0ABZ2BUL4_9RHOB|nr:FGGY family carbohydrate kinase [Roseobacter litoralis]MBC6966091.1 Xylulose kinase [Roseobacter litoralis]